MTNQLISYNSPEYISMCKLRNEVLRKPIGLILTKEEMLNDQGDILIGCIENNEVIGCCILAELDNNNVKLRQMAVCAECQGKGIGGRVLLYAEQIAKEKGYSNIYMHARKYAVAFYEKFDYNICGEEFLEVGIPHYKMEKKQL